MIFMQHQLKMSMEVEKSQETYSTEIQWQTKNCEGFLVFSLFETAQVQAFSTQAVKTSKLFAEAVCAFYCQATEILDFCFL